MSFLISLVTLFVFVLVFLFAVLIRNNSIVDILWGVGFIIIALLLASLTPSLASATIAILVGLWGSRLALHIYLRNRGRGEDFRYQKWRADWGQSWVIRSFFQIYLLQWLLMQLVALPIYLASAHNGEINLGFYVIGIFVWVVGFFFESVGDYQLTIFKSKSQNHGQLMTTGLWRYTRHPNYFGEATLWWGIALISFSTSYDWLVFIGPLVIDFLLLYVSGIPLLEAKYQGRKDWEHYAAKTSAFFPLPPRRIL